MVSNTVDMQPFGQQYSLSTSNKNTEIWNRKRVESFTHLMASCTSFIMLSREWRMQPGIEAISTMELSSWMNSG